MIISDTLQIPADGIIVAFNPETGWARLIYRGETRTITSTDQIDVPMNWAHRGDLAQEVGVPFFDY